MKHVTNLGEAEEIKVELAAQNKKEKLNKAQIVDYACNLIGVDSPSTMELTLSMVFFIDLD